MKMMTESSTDKLAGDFRTEVTHRFDLVDQKLSVVDEKFSVVNEKFVAVDQRFEQVDKRFDRVEGQIHGLRGELNSHVVETKRGFEALNARFDSMYRAIIGAGVVVAAAVIGAPHI